MKTALILTCEHAVNTIPEAYQSLFQDQTDVLNTHRGIDIGAEMIASHLAELFSCQLYQKAQVSRLLIDCNRSLRGQKCFSEWTKTLAPDNKKSLITNYYLPFREPVIKMIDACIKKKQRVLHLSIHSFTPILNGIERTTDIGLLYDPQRTPEKNFARSWQQALSTHAPHYRVRMNYPYLGTSDGFTSALRRRYSEKNYLGLELETNQALMHTQNHQNQLIQTISQSLKVLRG